MGWGVWDNDIPGGRDDHCEVQRSGGSKCAPEG